MDLVGFLFADGADYKFFTGKIKNWLSRFNLDIVEKGIVWNPLTRTLTLPKDSVIRGEGTLRVVAAEDLIHQSGDGKGLHRPKQPQVAWSIWDNPSYFDSDGRPQPMMQAWTKEGVSVIIPVPFNSKGYVNMEGGKVILPVGLLPEDPFREDCS